MMTKVLLVDDDPMVLRIYQRGLAERGMEVQIAGDGLKAIKALREAKPDAVVLDLMMPQFSGVEVLKFIRGQADLANLPVVVLSNAYMDEMAREAAAIGAQRSLLKVGCKPSLLAECLRELLAGAASQLEPSQLVAAPASAPAAAKPPPADSPVPPPGVSLPPAPAPARTETGDTKFKDQAREDLFHHAAETRAAIRQMCRAFEQAANDKERVLRLETLYRKVHFLSATAGLAGCHLLAQVASAFEAMLFQMMDRPERTSPSVMRTTHLAVEFLESLLEPGSISAAAPLSPAQVLVVDDDALSNRLVVMALRQAHLQARSIQDPQAGLQLLQQHRFDLVLLDIGLPGIDGFEFYKRLRAMPGYQSTPVIYVTALVDFDQSANNMLAGGEDVIAKPVLPTELAVKTVMHLAKAQLTGTGAGRS